MKLVKSTALAAAVAASGLFAQTASAEFSGNVSVVSDYLFRGISQTAGGSAVQGGVDYADASGVYVGTWASNVGNENEVDYYIGWGGDLGGGVSLDVSFVALTYTQRDFFLDYEEIVASLSFGGFTITALQALDITVTGEEEDAPYIAGSYDFTLSDSLSLNVTVGQWDFDNDADYVHTDITLTKTISDDLEFSFGLSDNDNETAVALGSNADQVTAFIGLSSSFSL